MSRKCDLTGTGAMSGNNVSHSQRKTRRRFLPNIQRARFRSDALEREFVLNVTNKTLRSVDHNGGFDLFLTTAKANNLTPLGQKIRRQVKKAVAEKAA